MFFLFLATTLGLVGKDSNPPSTPPHAPHLATEPQPDEDWAMAPLTFELPPESFPDDHDLATTPDQDGEYSNMQFNAGFHQNLTGSESNLEVYTFPTDLAPEHIEALVEAMLDFKIPQEEVLPVSNGFILSMKMAVEDIMDNPYEPEPYNLFINTFNCDEGKNYLLQFLASLYGQQKDELFLQTLKLFYPLSENMNDDNVQRLMLAQNLLNMMFMEKTFDLLSAFFHWYKPVIFARKCPILDKRIFLVDAVWATLDEKNEDELKQFCFAFLDFSPKGILLGFTSHFDSRRAKKYNIRTRDYTPFLDFLNGGPVPSACVFDDIPRGMDYSFTLEGKTLELKGRPSEKTCLEQIRTWANTSGFSEDALKRLADFIINFPSQGIFATKYAHGSNGYGMGLTGAKQQIQVDFLPNNCIQVEAVVKGKVWNVLVIKGLVSNIRMEIDMKITFCFQGSLAENKSIPETVNVSNDSVFQPLEFRSQTHQMLQAPKVIIQTK